VSHAPAPVPRRRTVVELCGLPGAGKSTLAAALAEVLTTAGIEVTVLDLPISARAPATLRAARRLRHAATTTVRRPVDSVRAAQWFGALGQPPSDSASAYVQWLALQRIVHAARRDAGVQLLEEGTVQTLWTALLRAPRRPSTLTAWDRVPPSARSDLVLHVDVPVPTAAARLAGRDSRHSRTQQLGPDARAAELAHGHELLLRLLEDCPVPVLRLSNDDGRTHEQAARSVAPQLVALVTAGSPGPR
jgi:thymidylate kinase